VVWNEWQEAVTGMVEMAQKAGFKVIPGKVRLAFGCACALSDWHYRRTICRAACWKHALNGGTS